MSKKSKIFVNNNPPSEPKTIEFKLTRYGEGVHYEHWPLKSLQRTYPEIFREIELKREQLGASRYAFLERDNQGRIGVGLTGSIHVTYYGFAQSSSKCTDKDLEEKIFKPFREATDIPVSQADKDRMWAKIKKRCNIK